MATLAAPAINWLSTPEPQSAAALAPAIGTPVIVAIVSATLPAPDMSGGGGDASVGYAG